MKALKQYVLGFAFSENRMHAVLIKKEKPEWQKGCLNGVGGKIEAYDADHYDAMVREFEEETGLATTRDQWNMFGQMNFENDVIGGRAEVYLFRMFSNEIYKAKSMEIEEIKIVSFNDYFVENDLYPRFAGQKIIKNLQVLIPMAIDEDFAQCIMEVL